MITLIQIRLDDIEYTLTYDPEDLNIKIESDKDGWINVEHFNVIFEQAKQIIDQNNVEKNSDV